MLAGSTADLPNGASIAYWVDDLGTVANPFLPPGTPPVMSMFDHEMFRVRGWAFDTAHRAKVGGVELVIDDKTYQVHSECARPDLSTALNELAYSYCGFQSAIRGAAVGLGAHDICLRFISHNMRSYAETPTVRLVVAADTFDCQHEASPRLTSRP